MGGMGTREWDGWDGYQGVGWVGWVPGSGMGTSEEKRIYLSGHSGLGLRHSFHEGDGVCEIIMSAHVMHSA